MKKIYLYFLLSLKPLWMRPFKTILTVIGVSTGISLFLAINIINFSAVDSLVTNVNSLMGETDLSVKSTSGSFDTSILDKIEGFSEVQYATGIITDNTYMMVDGQSKKKISILAIDFLKEGPFRSYNTSDGEDLLVDPMAFLNTPNGIIITKSFADQFGLKYQSNFELLTSNGLKTFEVGGVLNTEGVAKAFGGGLAIMDLMAAQYLYGKVDQVTKADIILWPDQDVESAKVKLQKRLGDSFIVETPGDQIGQLKQLVKSFSSTLSIIGLFTWFIGLFVVYSSIRLSLNSKIKEIGIIRSLGGNRQVSFYLLQVEALVIGILSTLLAILLARWMSSFLIGFIFQTYENQFRISLGREITSVPAYYYLLTGFFGVITCQFAAVSSSYAATKVDPLIAIKSMDMTYSASDGRPSLKGFLVGLLVFISSIGLITFFSRQFGIASSAALFILSFATGLYLLKPFTYAVLYLLKTIVPLKLPVLWMSVNNCIQAFNSTYSAILRVSLNLLFIAMLLVMSQSIVSGFNNFFESHTLYKQAIMSDSDMFNMQMVPFNYTEVSDVALVEGVKTNAEGQLFKWRHHNLIFRDKKIGVNATDGFLTEKHMRKHIGIKDTHSDFNFSSFFKDDSQQVLASTSFLKNFEYKIGDTVEIKSSFDKLNLKIVGSYIDFADPLGSVQMSFNNLKKISNDERVSTVGYFVKDGYKRQQVNRRVEELLANKRGLKLFYSEDVIKGFKDKLDGSFIFINAIVVVSLFVTVIGLFAPFIYQIYLRMKEFGVLRSNGLSLKSLISMLFLEQITVAFISFLYTLTIGVGLVYILYEHVYIKTIQWDMPILISSTLFISLFFISLLLVVISSVFPILKLKNEPIHQLIRYE